MRSKVIISCMVLLSSFNIASANAQWSSTTKLMPLAEVVNQAKDDQWVKTRGYLVKRLSHDSYLLKMGTSELEVEIDQYVFPVQPFDESTLIEVEGEIDIDWPSGIELDVEKITIVNR
ncbi:NirD/YgiW/YdeI family stress tolerance protein [Thiomicrorhabdus sp. 6S2-11]|uniref:NirD/YgiW/YdeI family stress tolerance protein n=1 Tax=Thiomicrorhabdus marina TaxID=2818442 RepID=A0ABS3Q3P0_9GAMM|nr:NirD/YgiW/YdeI family stress tolerance protein [Thiomicrorhabdus marina]MBO1926763.1 NirD/YgiW/YdeI family stress tolerance protein [Thiomicrorhabdus marina]